MRAEPQAVDRPALLVELLPDGDPAVQSTWLSLIFVWQINLITNKINMLNNINIKQ